MSGNQRVGLGAAALALAGMVFTAADASAQVGDERWLPWLGCWVSVEAPETPMLCMLPAEEGVELRRIARSGVTDSRTLVADGEERPTTTQGCTGVEQVSFSQDRQRVFKRTSLTCEGDLERSSRGILAMVEPDEWVEVEAVELAGQSVAWVKRYRPAPQARIEEAGLEALQTSLDERGMALEAARLTASAQISVEDIIEAYAATDPEAVSGWIAEQGDPIELDADRLVQLADAGVSPEVIDVAIATSYPERFQLAREPIDRDRGRRIQGYIDPWGYYSPWGYSPWSYRYSPYASFGLGYGGYYPYYGGYRPTVVVIRPNGDDGVVPGRGRVINDRGYTRPEGAPSTGRKARPSGYGSVRSGGSSGSSTAAPASKPSSSGSSKGKAKPRGGGG